MKLSFNIILPNSETNNCKSVASGNFNINSLEDFSYDEALLLLQKIVEHKDFGFKIPPKSKNFYDVLKEKFKSKKHFILMGNQKYLLALSLSDENNDFEFTIDSNELCSLIN